MANGDGDDDEVLRKLWVPCEDCGRRMCGAPIVTEPEFECAKALADLVWERLFDGTERGTGAVCMTAALLFKRAGRRLGVSATKSLAGLALVYMEQARAMIQGRRERAQAASVARKVN
jgi:hypothetical protein